MTRTECPARTSWLAKRVPMKPAPPVIKIEVDDKGSSPWGKAPRPRQSNRGAHRKGMVKHTLPQQVCVQATCHGPDLFISVSIGNRFEGKKHHFGELAGGKGLQTALRLRVGEKRKRESRW